MTIYQRMDRIFEEAQVPGFLLGWRPSSEYPTIPELLAAYQLRAGEAALCADDIVIAQQWRVSVHIYGKRDISEATLRLERAIAQNEMELLYQRDIDDVKDGDYIYHKQLELIFIEHMEEWK